MVAVIADYSVLNTLCHIQNCHLLATIYLQQSITANREEEIHFIVARVLEVL